MTRRDRRRVPWGGGRCQPAEKSPGGASPPLGSLCGRSPPPESAVRHGYYYDSVHPRAIPFLQFFLPNLQIVAVPVGGQPTPAGRLQTGTAGGDGLPNSLCRPTAPRLRAGPPPPADISRLRFRSVAPLPPSHGPAGGATRRSLTGPPSRPEGGRPPNLSAVQPSRKRKGARRCAATPEPWLVEQTSQCKEPTRAFHFVFE